MSAGLFLTAVSVLLGLRLVVLVLLAALDVWRRWHRPLAVSDALPPLVVLVPAYNEEAVIEGTVRSLLASDHPSLSVWVIDDGSTDRTVSRVQGLVDAQPERLRLLVCEENGGKSAALNRGLAASGASTQVAVVDADTLVSSDTLRCLSSALTASGADAAASNVKVGNRSCWLTCWQSIEYIVGLNLNRRAQAVLGCITTIPGAACVFRRDAVMSVGGFSSETVVEDTDLTLSLQRAGHRIIYVPEAIAYTEAPTDWTGLVRQRSRWMRGYLQCLWKHRAAFFRRSTLGWFGMPDLLLVHLLLYLLVPLSLPPLLALLQGVAVSAVVWSLLAATATEVILAALAYRADREAWVELWHLPLRRLIWPWFLMVVFCLVWWRILRGHRVRWGKPTRQGALAASGPGVLRSGTEHRAP